EQVPVPWFLLSSTPLLSSPALFPYTTLFRSELADFDAHGRAGPHLVGGRHVDHGHRTLRDSSSSMRSLSTSSISGTWIFWITSLKNPRTTSWRATSSGMPRDMR